MLNKEYNFLEFENTSKKQWLEKVSSDLKGKPINDLNWLHNKKEYTPFYTEGDIESISSLSLNSSSNLWLNLQRLSILDSNFEIKALEGLNNGADGLIIEVEMEHGLINAMKNILPQHCHLSLTSTKNSTEISEVYFNHLKSLSLNREDINGLGFWLDLIQIDVDKNDFFLDVSKLSHIVGNCEFSGFQNLLIDTNLMSLSNKTPSNEIAVLLSFSVSLINGLLNEGLDFDQIASNIFFRLKSNGQYFKDIARIRALKILSKEMMKLYDSEINIFPHIHVDICNEDEYSYLRNTTEAMSSVIAGADSIAVSLNSEKTQDIRIARNVSNIIKEESYLDKSLDVSSGSYFIESLTYDIAKESWESFSKIEGNGGLEKNVSNGGLNKLLIN